MMLPGQKPTAPKPKKVKKKLTIAEEINQENRQNEKNDEALSSSSDDASTSSSGSDEDRFLVGKS